MRNVSHITQQPSPSENVLCSQANDARVRLFLSYSYSQNLLASAALLKWVANIFGWGVFSGKQENEGVLSLCLSVLKVFRHGLQDGYLSSKPHIEGKLFLLYSSLEFSWVISKKNHLSACTCIDLQRNLYRVSGNPSTVPVSGSRRDSTERKAVRDTHTHRRDGCGPRPRRIPRQA